ncbi:MAG: trichohyalin [Parcubacteria group bacterium Gr01-1014_13]|nr:MAG: trichohyalin [Parcubacteria group bacterium Gr01-1014_13]
MNLRTRINLWKLKKSMSPSRDFKANLRKNLAISWDAKHGKAPWYQLGMRHAAASFSVITLLLSGGGAVYAYNSPEVTEGTTFYPIKQVIETVEEVVQITPEAKAKFYLKKIERREAERKVLEKNNPLIVELKLEVEGEDADENVEEDKKEVKEKNKDEEKDEVVLRKIKRTQQSIEKAEEELEKTRQLIEKDGFQDIKLREELRKRMERRLEKRKKQLEIKIENRQEIKVNLQGKIENGNSGQSNDENRSENQTEEKSRIRVEELIKLNN